MRISRIRLMNWLRYSGSVEVALDASIYAVTGRFAHDDRRSNWSGKTSLLEAIRFALYGVHRAPREDDWITHGESEGCVEVEFGNGLMIRRSRQRGRATQFIMVHEDATASGDDAQKAVAEWTGLTREDFEATCWIGQKALARFILARPGERFDTVSGWVGLGPLQRCEERARLRLSEFTTSIASAEAIVAASERVLIDARTTLGLAASVPLDDVLLALNARVDQAHSRVEDAERIGAKARAGLDAAHARKRHDELLREQAEVNDSLRGAKEKFDALPPADAGEHGLMLAEARAAMQTAGGEVKSKASLARGEFDGHCPVAGIACPARGDINRMAAENRVLHKQALEAYDTTCRAEAVLRHAHDTAVRIERDRAGLLGQRDTLRKRALALREATRQAPPDGPGLAEAEADVRASVEVFEDAAREHATALAVFERAQNAMLDRARMQDTVDKAKDECVVLRAALRVFGRQGAQQRIAEAALGEIEQGANALLRDAGIDLSVTMRWSREAASGLAVTCDACGAPFPASQRVKRCERCGAERPPKTVEKLDVDLSDRSGAAEDLAGAALQLAASAWLRRERDVRWSVALIDEPFGALDEANRRAFAAHLVKMLRGRFGFEQSFIVAHSPDVLDAMPARIVVTADEYGSTLEVA